jgi:hypothetical protein
MWTLSRGQRTRWRRRWAALAARKPGPSPYHAFLSHVLSSPTRLCEIHPLVRDPERAPPWWRSCGWWPTSGAASTRSRGLSLLPSIFLPLPTYLAPTHKCEIQRCEPFTTTDGGGWRRCRGAHRQRACPPESGCPAVEQPCSGALSPEPEAETAQRRDLLSDGSASSFRVVTTARRPTGRSSYPIFSILGCFGI